MVGVTIDLDGLNELRRAYQARSEDVGQAYVELWDDREAVEVAAREAGRAFLDAVHRAWPAIAGALASNAPAGGADKGAPDDE